MIALENFPSRANPSSFVFTVSCPRSDLITEEQKYKVESLDFILFPPYICPCKYLALEVLT